MHTAACVPFVGAIQSIILPKSVPALQLTPPVFPIVISFTAGAYSALVVTTNVLGLAMGLCTNLMTAHLVGPSGSKVWAVGLFPGTSRIVVPEIILSISLDGPPGVPAAVVTVWLEDHIPALSQPAALPVSNHD